MKVLFICSLIFISAYAGTEEAERAMKEAKEEPKEKNYKKFVGETTYPIPFATKISSPLQDGQTIHALGRVKPEAKRININFQKGPHANSDLPLHISVRWDEGVFSGNLVYNTRVNGNWSTNEQRLSNPFKANDEFDLRIRLVGDKIQVFANRDYLGSFDQKMPLNDVDHITIDGDLGNLRLFHYGGREYQVPYSAKVELVPGKRVDLSVLPKGNRVDIELYNKKHDEIVLQLSIRFKEGAVVRNSLLGNNWGKEEREGTLPITKDKLFDLTIINESFGFQIFLNGERFASYSHRTNPKDVEVLKVDGKAELHTITINDALGV